MRPVFAEDLRSDGDAGAVDHPVQTAEFVDRCIYSGVGALLIGNVGLYKARGVADPPGDAFAGLLVQVCDEHLRARFREVANGRRTEARAAAGYQKGAIRYLH